MKNEHLANINSVFCELKDFQTKTVEYAYDQLNKNRRYLVADEVGLGKTKIAKGVIAKAFLDHHKKKGKKAFRVFYICSNQALASQNLKDLNIFNDSDFIDADLSRLIYLAKKSSNKNSFSLSSLTPSTSFKIAKGTGLQYERMLIYTVLAELKARAPLPHQKGLKWLLMGNVSSWVEWQERIDWYYHSNKYNLVKNISKLYYGYLKATPIPSELKECTNEVLEYKREVNNVFDLILAYSHLLRNKNKNSVSTVNKQFSHRSKLVNFLRRALIDVSLENLDADLFILDEFQRFKELVAIGNNKDSEASKVARKIFSIEHAKCLMLSATPFRMYTSKFDEIENEDYYSELTDLLTFLNGDKPILNFESLRQEFFKALKNGEVNDSAISTKTKLENLYKSVLCRTEKIIVADDKDSIVLSRDKQRLKTEVIDFENFIHTDKIFQTIKLQFGKRLNYSIDYNKSVPYPMSFMDGYKSKNEFTKLLEQNPSELNPLIRKNKNAWLNLEKLQAYQLSSFPNAKFRHLINETIDDGEMWKLLWLPPSLPNYKGMGVFANKSNLSKTLIFSRWVMVPKMIAGLVSYEVERRTLTDKSIVPDSKPRYTPKKRTNGKSQARKPLPLLSLKINKGKPSSLRSFTLLYPSKTLSELDFFPLMEESDYKQVRNEKLVEIQSLLNQLKKYETNNLIDKDWYWAAPILLDKLTFPNEYSKWINSLRYHSITKRSSGGNESKAASEHIKSIKLMFTGTVEDCGLGKMPLNLAKTMMDIAFGSPANSVLRSFLDYFEWQGNSQELLNHSLDLAYDFMLFFDKPETINAIQINEAQKDKRIKDNRDKTDIHWNLVLRYCIDGNLLAVVKEYCHMLYSKNKTIESLSDALAKGLNIRTSYIKVEGLKKYSLDNKLLRCHYSVSFGNQNLESVSGVNRAGDIMSNFNSPFRPFVLASTSLGQEGLDFHYYCRKIMHWNLPRNPVEFEQREGRINRFKGLVIRQNIAVKYRDRLHNTKDVWTQLFKIAEEEECKKRNKPEIIPFWFTEPIDNLKIERIVPLLPLSKDISLYENLISILAIYRLTFGQPNQEDLIKAIKSNLKDEQDLKDLYQNLLIQLCPYYFANNPKTESV